MAQEYVDTKIQADKVVIFIKESCPYCVQVQDVLNKYDFKQGKLEIHDITGHADMKAIQDYFHNKTGAKTVPRVFIGTECVGGGSDVKQLHDNAVLKDKLIAIGAI
ncbi:glutaredoxin-1 [Leucoraja erinacea]|uniref:glutaredoxin-1 n=1 Tax=Leucoraja erinaceus TaxID=7782 RepID=UPI0024540B97|nr:glutaredoxin-1 [Leucoraja erinacea]